jgi:hypothetical protein
MRTATLNHRSDGTAMRASALLCCLTALSSAERFDATPMVEAIEQVQKLQNLRCTYLVQSGWTGKTVVPLRLQAVIRDSGAHRLTWSAWPKDLALPPGALAAPRADKQSDDPRINGIQVATTRNQHQVLDESNGKMTIWSFAPYDLSKGLLVTDPRIRGSLRIGQGYGFDLPFLSPVSLAYSVAYDPQFASNGLIGLAVLTVSRVELKRLVNSLCVARKQLPDGRVALAFENAPTMLAQWHILRKHPDCGGAWVVDEVRYGDPKMSFEDAAACSRTYTYIPIDAGGAKVPLVSLITTTTEEPLSPTWDQVVLVSHQVDPALRDADVAIDATEAKSVFDRAVGMEREAK